jgi:hypothetical protein
MNKIVLEAQIGADGVLTLRIPLDKADAHKPVRVIVEPLWPPPMDREAYLKFIEETAGQWKGELERPEQGEYEHRLEWP